jgi:CDP-diacylglycerol--glycerol-3-phosphate 3-phosphatidyltransferase
MWTHANHMNLPNAITVSRIFLVPLLVVVLLTQFSGRQILGVPKELIGAAIFALASLTDWADGYVARRRKQITPLGQVIDPFADKLLTSAALISLVEMNLAAAWMVTVIVGREFLVTGLRSIAYSRGVAIPASPLGKVKMIAQVVAILALILAHDQANEGMYPLFLVGQAALWVVLAAALISAADYFRRFNIVLNPRAADAGVSETKRKADGAKIDAIRQTASSEASGS